MGNVFGAQKPLKEIIRENQRMIRKAIRELEKEVSTLQNNEKKLVTSAITIQQYFKYDNMTKLLISKRT